MNDQLEQLEEQLLEMPLVKRLSVYFVVFASIVYAGWYVFGEDLFLELESKEQAILTLDKKIRKNSLKSLTTAITRVNKQIMTQEDTLVTLHFKDQFVRTQLDTLDFVYYNDLGIATVLDKILKNSLSEKIDIDFLKTTKNTIDYAPHIVNQEQITIQGNGTFRSILSLIQHIDYYNALLQIHEIKVFIDEEGVTNFDLNISHFGVKI
jgi:hypothetical protein